MSHVALSCMYKMEMEYVSVKRYYDTLHKYQILANDTHVTRNGVFIAQAFIYFHLFTCCYFPCILRALPHRHISYSTAQRRNRTATEYMSFAY